MNNKRFIWLKNYFPVLAISILALFFSAVQAAAIDISDRPLDVEFQAASTTVMFLLDDSGSMDSEQMTPDPNGQYGYDYYVFNYPHAFATSIADSDVWKTQWAGYNRIYYDPSVNYKPWPSHTTADALLPNADMLNPLTHQYQSGVDFDDHDKTFNISGEFLSVGISSTTTIAFDTHKDQSGDVKDLDGFVPLGTITVASGDGDSWQLVIERDAGSYTMAPVVRFKKGINVIFVSPGDDEYSDTKGWDTSGNTTYGGVHYKYTNDSGATATYKPTLTVGDWEISYYERASSYWGQTRFYAEKKPSISIKNSHYYLLNDTGGDVPANANNGVADAGEVLYLVNIDGSDLSNIQRTFYQVANNDLRVADGELTEIAITAIPEAIRPPADHRADLQNFANWFSYYSRRELVAKACVGSVIAGLSDLKVGLYSINGSVNLAALPVSDTDINGNPINKFSLLKELYNGNADDNTPLRGGLRTVGEYYRGNSSNVRARNSAGTKIIAPSPYDTVDNGGSCQQVYTIAMTDGYWSNYSISGFPDAPSSPDPKGISDGISNSLADVAYYYYTTDLQPALPPNVPTNTCDPNANQHMVTYGVSFGVTGTLNPDDYDACTLIGKAGTSVAGQTPNWPSAQDNLPTKLSNAAKIDDLWHAAASSTGKFFSAKNPNELVESLNGIFSGIAAREIAGSSVAVSTEKIYSSANMFQATYNSDGWVGEVESYPIHYDATLKGITIEKLPSWTASKKLSEVTSDSRKIITYNPDPTVALGSRGEIFTWVGLSQLHKNMILGRSENDTSTFSDDENTTGGDIVNYLRGKDDVNFRTRPKIKIKTLVSGEVVETEGTKTNKLGDIAHSSPILIDDYIYVGANDGMLHVFDKSSGVEAFAYIPDLVFDNLNQLIDENYQHKFFVDQTPTYAKIYNPESTKTEKYVLGGLGKGGKGYYCLNITDIATAISSENAAKAMVAWEFTDEEMGYSFSKPAVVRTKNEDHPYIVIVGNGYNSQSGEGAFYILDLLTGEKIKKLSTEVTGDNGVSSAIAIDVNNDYIVDYAYAGDLKGNLWKLDFTSAEIVDWDFAFFDGTKPAPLFTTMANQPITSRPDVTRHCDSHGYLIAFGTGKYLGVSDLDTDDIQAMYAVWDYGDDDDDGESLGSFLGDMTASSKVANHPDANANGTEIRVRMLYHDPGTSVVQVGGAIEKCAAGTEFAEWKLIADKDDPNPNQTKKEGEKGNPRIDIGWFLPMTGFKERIVQDPMILSGTLLFLSKTPVPGVCTGGGFSMVYSLGVCDGVQLECAWTTPDTKELNMPVPVDTPDGEKLIFGKEGAGEIGRIDKDKAGPKIPKGIFYWQEIND